MFYLLKCSFVSVARYVVFSMKKAGIMCEKLCICTKLKLRKDIPLEKIILQLTTATIIRC